MLRCSGKVIGLLRIMPACRRVCTFLGRLRGLVSSCAVSAAFWSARRVISLFSIDKSSPFASLEPSVDVESDLHACRGLSCQPGCLQLHKGAWEVQPRLLCPRVLTRGCSSHLLCPLTWGWGEMGRSGRPLEDALLDRLPGGPLAFSGGGDGGGGLSAFSGDPCTVRGCWN